MCVDSTKFGVVVVLWLWKNQMNRMAALLLAASHCCCLMCVVLVISTFSSIKNEKQILSLNFRLDHFRPFITIINEIWIAKISGKSLSQHRLNSYLIKSIWFCLFIYLQISTKYNRCLFGWLVVNWFIRWLTMRMMIIISFWHEQNPNFAKLINTTDWLSLTCIWWWDPENNDINHMEVSKPS